MFNIHISKNGNKGFDIQLWEIVKDEGKLISKMENQPILHLNERQNAHLFTDPLWDLPVLAGFRLRIENRLFNAH